MKIIFLEILSFVLLIFFNFAIFTEMFCIHLVFSLVQMLKWKL